MAKRVVLRAGLAYVLFALVGLSLVSSASAAPEERKSMTVTIFKGAWYAQVPPCLSAIDCSMLPEANPYPEDTLHVALSGGEETARSYIALSFILPPDGKLTGGTLELPVDADPSHGSVAPEEAEMVACLASRRFKPVRGSVDKPPATKCALRQGAHYDDKKDVFTVDLDRFVDEWDKGIAALALLPSDNARAGPDTWHVVFPAAKKAAEGEEVIAATLTYTILEDATSGLGLGSDQEPAAAAPPPVGDAALPPSSFAAPSGFSAPPVAPVESAPPAPTEVVSAQPASAVAASTAGFAGEGFAYPIVWAFPLVVLVGYGLIGRALTKEL